MRLPTDEDRVAIIGSTGSGKTQFGVWLLSTRRFDLMPWVIFDFKGDKLIARLGAKEISITDKPPTKPGLYIVRPDPDAHDATELFMVRCWEQERVGIFIDEGYMISRKSKAFPRILTQGRSKRVPCITLTQRPSWISRFVFSEANFFAVFRLTDEDDVVTVKRFIGKAGRALVNRGLPSYHSVFFDVGGGAGHGAVTLLKPVPSQKDIIATFRAKLKPQRGQQRVI